MRFNEGLEFGSVDVSWVTEDDILAETAMLPWVTVEEALAKGQDLARFFIYDVLSPEMRRDPRTRINTERVYLFAHAAPVQPWHLDFPKNYKVSEAGDLTFMAAGDRRHTQICGAVDLPGPLVRGSWSEELNAYIQDQVDKGELPITDVATGTRVQSTQPFIHRGGPRYGTGWRWFADAYRPLH